MKDKKLPQIGEFCSRRIKKIYPLWLMTTIFFLVLSIAEFWIRNEINISNVSTLLYKTIIDIFLVQSWIPGYPYLFDLNGPGWFLSSMLLLWILTIPMLKIIQKMTTKKKMSFLSGILCFQIIWDFIRMNVGVVGQYATGIWWIYPFSSYFAGLLFGYEFKPENYWNKYTHGIFPYAFIIGGIPFCYLVTFKATFIENAVLIIYMMYLVMILACGKSSLSKIMSNKILVFIGSISFEIYLLHIPIDRFIGFFGFIHNELLSFAIIICLTIMTAVAWKKLMSLYKRKTN